MMVTFYANLRAGQVPHEALRRAKLGMRADPIERHPFFWAPFIVVGG